MATTDEIKLRSLMAKLLQSERRESLRQSQGKVWISAQISLF